MAEESPKTYSLDDIPRFSYLESLRVRPGAWGVPIEEDSAGRRWLPASWFALQLVENSVDQAKLGKCGQVRLALNEDGSCTVSDDGPGISSDPYWERDQRPTSVVFLTEFHARGPHKMPGRYLRYPPHPEPRPFSGIHPPGGLKVASGLSETFLLETTTSRTRTILKTERGILVEDPVIEAGDYLETGTKITFLPDREKNLGRWPGSTESENLAFTDYLRPRILVRMHQWAALNPGLTLVLEDRRKGFPHFEQIRYPDGLLSYLRNLNQTEEILSPTLYFEHKHPQFSLSVAIEFSESLRTRIISFANGEHTIEGGPHVTGVVAGLLSAYRQRSKGRHKFLKSEDVLPGISAVVAIELQRPKFTSAAHIRLVNEVHADVRRVTQRNIARFFRENPKIADTLVSNITSAFQRRYRSHDKSPFGL